jgi:hypothetical protein
MSDGKSNISSGSRVCPERKGHMGLWKVGPNRWAYDVHVWGAAERPRGVFEGTIYKARAFYASECARLKRRSLKFTTVGEVLAVYLREHYEATTRYKTSKAPYRAVIKAVGHYPLSAFRPWISWHGWSGRR